MNETLNQNQIVTHIAKDAGLSQAQAQAEFDAHADVFGYKIKNVYSRGYGTRLAKAVVASISN